MRSSRAWIVAALIGMIAVLGFMFLGKGGQDETEQVAQQPAADLGGVVVVKQDIGPRTILTPEMVEVQQVPAEYVHPMALVKVEDALKMITLVPVNAGEQLLATKVADPNTNYLSYKLKEGHVAYTVPVSDLTGAAGMIRVGDIVHVLGNFAKDVAGKDQSKFVLYDLKVLTIGQNMAVNGTAENAESFSSMTLEVTADQAQKLSWAQNHGSLTFILKSVLDKSDEEELVAVEARTFFGDEDKYKDLEYMNTLKEISDLREAEQKLLEYGKGDLQRIRENLEYDRFYYDDLNPNSGAAKKGDTGAKAGATTPEANTKK